MDRRKSNHHAGEYIEFSEALFATKDCISIAGVRVVPVMDGTGRYAATWKDEEGRDRISVCGRFGPSAIMYRNTKAGWA